MSAKLYDVGEVSHLIHDLEDAVITPEDHARLMELMREHASVRQMYLEHMEIVALLQESADSRVRLGTMPVSQEMLARGQRRNAFLSLTYGLAAMLVLGVGFLFYQIQQMPDSRSIVMESSHRAVYSVVHVDEGSSEGSYLGAGDKIVVERGLVNFVFPSGVEALAEGPTEIEIKSESAVKMTGGTAWYRVPKEGRGFVVETDGLEVVDLGTEFGVRFQKRGGLEVHVAKGLVRADPNLKKMPEVELFEGEAMSFDSVGRGVAVDCKTGSFHQKFTAGMSYLPYVHWSFDELEGGSFAAEGTIPETSDFSAKLRELRAREFVWEASAYQAEGRFGKAISFKGDGVFAESAFSGLGGDAPRSVAMWVRHRQEYEVNGIVSPYCVWGSRITGRLWKISLREGKGGYRFHSSPIGPLASSSSLMSPVDEWTHYVSIYMGEEAPEGSPKVVHYVNGVRQEISRQEGDDLKINTDLTTRHAMPVRFGADVTVNTSTRSVDGDLDEVYIFRGVLSEQEIKQLMETNRLDFMR